MKYTGIILGSLSSFLLLIVATYSVLTCQFGLAIVLMMMFILTGGIVMVEYNELNKGGKYDNTSKNSQRTN
jgi:hypothetical protein